MTGGDRRRGWLDAPDRSRLAPDHPRRAEILEAHARAVAEGRPTYVDPDSGYEVMTAASLSERGACCDQGCRHCPWLGAEVGPGA